MFITYFIQPWEYYNIWEEGCQEVNGILVTYCYFLGMKEEMWIFWAFWEGLFKLWTNYEFFVNFLKKDCACAYLFLPKRAPERENGQNWPSIRQGWQDNWLYICQVRCQDTSIFPISFKAQIKVIFQTIPSLSIIILNKFFNIF